MNMNVPLGRILAIDFGEKRIGIAASDPMQSLASAICTIDNTPKKKFAKIVDLVQQHQIVAIVVGMPFNMDGSMGDKAVLVQQFVDKLEQRVPKIPVFTWDERMTTISAENILHDVGKAPSKNRHIIDQIAAEVILKSFLDRLAFIKRNSSS